MVVEKKFRATDKLIVCKSCTQYIYLEEETCPLCNSNPNIASDAYLKSDLGLADARARLERALKKRM